MEAVAIGLQIDHDIRVDIALDTRIAVAHHVVPDAAIAALGHQLLPARAAECVLALLGAQLHNGIEEGQVEAPHLDPRASRGICYGSIANLISSGFVVRRRRDGGLDGRECFGEASCEEQLGRLSVCFGDLR